MSPTAAEQVADVISAIAKVAWPLVVVVLLLRYRDAVQGVLRHREVSKFSLGPVSAEFAAVTRSIEAAASQAGIDEPGTGELGVERTLVEELARADPRAAVTTTWARVRDASGIAVARRTDEPLRASTVGKLEQLQAHGLLKPQLVDLGRTLKAMETTVLAQPRSEIPTDFARAFSLAAMSLAKGISELIPEGYEGPSGGSAYPGYTGYGYLYGSAPAAGYGGYEGHGWWYGGSTPQASGEAAYDVYGRPYGNPPAPGAGASPEVDPGRDSLQADETTEPTVD